MEGYNKQNTWLLGWAAFPIFALWACIQESSETIWADMLESFLSGHFNSL